MDNKSQSLELFSQFLSLIEKKGVRQTISILKESQNDSEESEKMFYAFITNVVCTEFKISKDELFYGRTRKGGVRANALCVFCGMMQSEAKLSQRDIADLIDKDPVLVHRYVKNFNNFSSKSKAEKDLLKKSEKIKTEINKYEKYGKEY